jgi:4-amino-4-deoxy-L-arabinose transferase-like glycosyltransferase
MRYLRQLPAWVDIVWCALLAIYVLIGSDIVPFHGDESTLIYMGRDTYHHFVEGDMSKIYYDDTWTISPSEQQLRLINGTIPKYIYGFVALSNGYQTVDEINEQWDWGADYIYNQDTYRIPKPALLTASRIASSLQFIIAIIAFFIVGRIALNRPTAYLASLYIVLHPNMLLNTRRAMMEGSHIMGLALLLLTAIWIINKRKPWHYLLLGIAGGVAVATKHPNAFIFALVLIGFFTLDLRESWRSQSDRVTSILNSTIRLGITGIIAVGLFWVLNPALWQSPVAGIQQSLSLRSDLLISQSESFEQYMSIGERLNGFFDFVFVASPQYYEVEQWADYAPVTEQIAGYEQSILSGVAVGGSSIGGVVVMLLTFFGALHFATNTRITRAYRWLLTVVGVGICLITFIVTPLAWARYYLPIFPFIGFWLAYALYTLSNIIRKQIDN